MNDGFDIVPIRLLPLEGEIHDAQDNAPSWSTFPVQWSWLSEHFRFYSPLSDLRECPRALRKRVLLDVAWILRLTTQRAKKWVHPCGVPCLGDNGSQATSNEDTATCTVVCWHCAHVEHTSVAAGS